MDLNLKPRLKQLYLSVMPKRLKVLSRSVCLLTEMSFTVWREVAVHLVKLKEKTMRVHPCIHDWCNCFSHSHLSKWQPETHLVVLPCIKWVEMKDTDEYYFNPCKTDFKGDRIANCLQLPVDGIHGCLGYFFFPLHECLKIMSSSRQEGRPYRVPQNK